MFFEAFGGFAAQDGSAMSRGARTIAQQDAKMGPIEVLSAPFASLLAPLSALLAPFAVLLASTWRL